MLLGEAVLLLLTDNSKLESGLDDAKKKTESASSGIAKGFGTAMSVALGNIISTAVTGGISKMVSLGASVVQTGLDFNNLKQQANIAFTTMLGSGEKAKSFLDDLQQFAAKTPFEFPDLLQASQRMLAMGFAAEDIKPTLTAIGDAVAGLGGGAAEIDRVTTALGQMNAKGKTSAGEMMQLTEAGIPAWDMLAQKIGVTVPEAMAMVEKGAIDAQTTIGAVVDGMEERFGGMMEKQSSTWGGLLSTLQDTFTQVSGTVMAPFFEMMTSGLQSIVEWVSTPEFAAGVQQMADDLKGAMTSMQISIGQTMAWIQLAWDTNWGNIRKTWEDFAKELPEKQQAFWDEWQKAFGDGSRQNLNDWEGFLRELFGGTTRWLGFVFDLLTGFLRNWNNTTAAFHALQLGDWSSFWSSVGANFTNAFALFGSFVDIFYDGWSTKQAERLNALKDQITGWWKGIVDWWNNTVGSVFGSLKVEDSSLAIVNPLNRPSGTQETINGIVNGTSTFPLPGGQSNTNSINVTQHFYGQTDPVTVKEASQDGVQRAARTLGMK